MYDILIVDDDPGAIQVMARILAGVGHARFATNGAGALRLARATPPDLIMLDAEMPGMTGFEVCSALKSDPALAEVPVVFVTSHRDETFEVAGFDVGGADFITKPVNPRLVLARVKTQLRLKHMADQLRETATTDALTGVANRRRLDEALDLEWKVARRTMSPLSFIMIDVDRFKQFNDHYGHPEGDTCLHAIAQSLSTVTKRPGDLVARYGGEEFAILLPRTHRAGAEHVARAALAAVEALAIPHESSQPKRIVTISAGIACYGETSELWRKHLSQIKSDDDAVISASASQLVRAADQALYRAKQGGRARAVIKDLGLADRTGTTCRVPSRRTGAPDARRDEADRPKAIH